MISINLSQKSVKDLKFLKKRFPKIDNDLDKLFSSLTTGKVIGARIREFKSFEIYKARLNNSSSKIGKSGGFRVIYYLKRSEEYILVLSIYSKTSRINISKKEILKILKTENLVK